MDLEFTEEEADLRANVADVLAGIAPMSVVRAIYEGTGDDSAVWEQMVQLDWPALTIPDAHGGIGLGFLEQAIVAEEMGRSVAPGPYLATVTQFVPAVRELGSDELQAEVLPRVAHGELTGTLALAEEGRWSPEAVKATASPVDGGWRLDGRKDAVLHGAAVDEVVVVASGTSATASERSSSPRATSGSSHAR